MLYVLKYSLISTQPLNLSMLLFFLPLMEVSSHKASHSPIAEEDEAPIII